jgi:hypothetical protein
MAQTAVPLARQVPVQATTVADATRHLCAGAYLDRGFRDMVISRVRHDCGHRVAPSYGYDLTAVVHHAWRAWLLDACGQALTVGVLGAVAAASPATVVTTACGAGAWVLGRVALRSLREMAVLRVRSALARWLRRTQRAADLSRHRELSRRVEASAGGCVALAVAGGVAAASHGSLARGILSAALMLGLLLAVSAAVAAVRQQAINRVRLGGALRPARLSGRLAVIDQQESCAWVVYRRPRPPDPAAHGADQAWEPEPEPGPFPGSGILVHRWLPPLSVQLLRPGIGSLQEREHSMSPFAAHELADQIRVAMEPVGDAADPSRLRGFAVADRIYIAETDLGDDRRFLTRPPAADEVAEVTDDPHHAARRHLEIQVTASGEMVTTVFLRVTVRGKALSLDFAACALTPTPYAYCLPDQYAEAGSGAVVRAAGRGAAGMPLALAGLWRLPLAPWVLAHAAWATRDRTLAPRRRRPPGIRFTLRDVTLDDWNRAEPDKGLSVRDEMKIIERRILTATMDFLVSHDIDTSEFTRQSVSIISSGVLNMGGHVEMHGTAVGTGAQVSNDATAGTGAGPGGGEPAQEAAP